MPMESKAIPKEHREALRAFVMLEDKRAARFVDSLKSAEARLLIGSLAGKVSAASGVDEAQARDFLLMLGSMSRTRRRAEGTIDQFLATIGRASREESVLSPEEVETQWPRASKHLADALRTRAIEVSAKALAVMTANERMMCNVRVLSDLRPIFTGDLEPTACVVLHQLKIAFHEQEDFDDVSEIFISLDGEDLVKLKSVLDRALQKHSKLEEMAKKLDMQVLTSKD